MKVLITGAMGQLGQFLLQQFQGNEEVLTPSRDSFNLGNAAQMEQYLLKHRPNVIIHAAAYTDVDQAEKNPLEAFRINSEGTWFIAQYAKQINAVIAFISTDYVFDGQQNRPYTEVDATNPINVYGISKLHGEKFVQLWNECHFVIRTSWLYGGKTKHFVQKVITHMKQQSYIQAATDMIGCPTYAKDVAAYVYQLIQTKHYGIYHAVNSGCCSRFDWVKQIIQSYTGPHPCKDIVPVPSAHFVTPAARPLYTPLLDTKSASIHLPPIRHWKSALKDFMETEGERL